MTTRRHCEPHESGPIPHTHLEPVLSSRGRRPWRSMYFGAMDCFTSFAKTTGSWKAQRGNPCLRHALVDCHASLAMTGLDADASLAMAALLSCIWETSRITAIRARSHACARRSHFFVRFNRAMRAGAQKSGGAWSIMTSVARRTVKYRPAAEPDASLCTLVPRWRPRLGDQAQPACP